MVDRGDKDIAMSFIVMQSSVCYRTDIYHSTSDGVTASGVILRGSYEDMLDMMEPVGLAYAYNNR